MTREEQVDWLCRLRADLNNGVIFTPWNKEFTEALTDILEQEPCEDEYIKVPKKALKYRTSGMVAYNVEWLKNHFDIERAVFCGAQEQGGDLISRDAVIEQTYLWSKDEFLRITNPFDYLRKRIMNLPSVNPQEPKTGHCKECKYFEYDSVAKVDGIPLIVAHEICSRWGDGCKTKED